MTAIVGVLCRDGLVMGTDSSATFTAGVVPTIEQPTMKLSVYADSIIVAGTGEIGLGQRFGLVIEEGYQQNLFKSTQHHIKVGTELCRQAVQDFASTNVKQGSFGALVGFPLGSKVYLCEFATSNFQPEFKTETIWYCSMGSGQAITDPFLALMREVFWKDGVPTIQDATFAVTWALDHAVQVNPGGINGPVKIAVLEKQGTKFQARILDEEDLDEHRENIKQAKELLRKFPASQRADAPNTPDVPAPPPDAPNTTA
jgi:20S proteasome alpha/beta subunit